MLQLMDFLKENKLIKSNRDFCSSINIQESAIKPIREGDRGFTVEQIISAAKKYNINLNWIAGFETEMRLKKASDPIANLKDAVRVIEAEYKKNKPHIKR
jgi:hypothetical protein